MENITPTRTQAFELLKKYNQNESLIKHALAVEAVMLHFADLLKADNKEAWGIIGLVHDLDYEKFPDKHCLKVREILQEEQWPEKYIRAIESHGWRLVNDIEPIEDLEKVLYTVDELTGLIAATVLLRPSKSILDLQLQSVKKKWKQKGFAAGVNREVIIAGAEILGMELDTIIEETIKGMQKVAEDIGLK
ncbi:MAG: HDIG domain-containing metalloprotein [Desulfitobacteriaceae bacterium]